MHRPRFFARLTVVREKMYKTKIAQWDLKKNYKASEKEQLARIAKAHHDSGQGIPTLTLRNRAAKMARVRRFCKQEKILEEICDDLPKESSSAAKAPCSTENSPARRAKATTAGVIAAAIQSVHHSSLSSMPGFTRRSFDPERPFSTASKDGRIELILWQTKIYYESRFASTVGPGKLKDAAQPASQSVSEDPEILNHVFEWRDKLVFGVTALRKQKSAEGWRLISEACGATHRALDQQHQSLFRELLFVFSDRDWTMYPDLSTHILRFFTKTSAAKLGCNHPLSIVLYHFQEQQVFTDTVRPALEVLMNVFGENLDPISEEFWYIKEDYCTMLRDRGDYVVAQSHGLRFLKQSEEVYGRLHLRTRYILLEIGYNHYHLGLDDLAEAEYLDVLQRGREDLGDDFPDRNCIDALQGLAWLYERQGNFVRREECWRAALGGTIEKWGMENVFTTYVIIELEDSLRNQGMDPEAWLQQNFGISCI